jgi:hypothetical protein
LPGALPIEEVVPYRMKMRNIEIEYCFQIEGDQSESYQVILDPVTLQSVETDIDTLPDWTDLTFHQCGNCPLANSETDHCPAAVNMVRLVQRFNQLLSYDSTMVVVITAERKVYSQTTVQRGVCSLMGLLMASSGCPLTAFFKPMARFHLPFASTEETIWRATSTYLLAQYFQQQKGSPPDVCFQGLSDIYDQIQTVNQSFAKRLRSACQHDSMINGIILLDMFAKSMPTAIEASLEDIRHLFEPYLFSSASS